MKEEQRDIYSLILNQLVHDGFIHEATKLSESTMIPCPLPQDATNKLTQLLQSTLAPSKDLNTFDDDDGKEMDIGNDKMRCLDLDSNSSSSSTSGGGGGTASASSPPLNKVSFLTKFITTHKNACRCAKFSWDGKFVATGSSDTSIKLLDVNKMRNYNQTKNETTEDFAPSRPVVRTFYDHSQPISDLDFHPSAPILASASKDCTIRFYDYKSSLKRSFKFIQDSHSVRTINFHPCGDMLLAGTDHHMIRLYDVNTFQSYTARKVNEHHHGAINQVRYSLDGNIFASCSKDNTIKIWDATNFGLINTIGSPHNAKEVTSIQISRNQKYLLSCGRDSYVKLWEISSGRMIHSINTGVNQFGNNKNRLCATFNCTEDFIITLDEQPSSVAIYNSTTGEPVQKLSGHIQSIRWIASSPVENALMTCSNDHRARFWTEDTTNYIPSSSTSSSSLSITNTKQPDIIL
ncbi:WD40 repeat-containing protein [Heterostelium album PN500]|uniref:Cleavage stimulation factor 50 kDa subunit n=1 Tax=Heterostelium pallidum (strain ATCC 26659 / Pp 5 / PN500) TaxID=670386 RepID=D3BCF1_HETP5|nr:WD40 repeat-containing protein [Heterostelium album PN500]EFA80941.1 WD40 repeat-containing protein [Heterostelium album PN500]|eukprot:XP_020433059.1 WD40 repeat-containing protein [Heterostelium album PN500]